MRRYFFIFILVSAVLYAQNVSLDEILKHASTNALSLKIKKRETLIESKNIESAKSAYYPTLNLVYNNEYTESLDGIPLGTESVGGITISNGTRYQNSAALQLNYDLYHFGVTDEQINIATLKRDIKDKEWCKAEKDLHKQIVELYADALKQQNEKDHRLEMLNIRKELYRMKERLYKAGEYSKVDLGDEAIYIISLERDIENALMQYKDDIIRLSQLSYMKIAEDSTLLPIELTNNKQESITFEDTVDAQILKRQIDQKRSELTLQFKNQLPSIGLYSNYYLYSSDPKEYDYPITHLSSKSWNVGFSIRFNIFEGFKNSVAQEQLELELKNLELQYEQAKHNFEYETLAKNKKIDELSIIQKQERSLVNENQKKLAMVQRLRKHRKVDRLTELNSQYELQERTLNLKNREIDAQKEQKLLQITNRGIQECTQH